MLFYSHHKTFHSQGSQESHLLPSDSLCGPGSWFLPVVLHRSPGAQVQQAAPQCTTDVSTAIIHLFHLPQFSGVIRVNSILASAAGMARLLKVSFSCNAQGKGEREKPKQERTGRQVKDNLKRRLRKPLSI